MGKKKSRAKVMKKAAAKVDKVFDCPFCSHANTVEVKMQRPKRLATLKCRICKADFEKSIGKLTKEVDVYCAWIDEAQERNKMQRDGKRLGLVDEAEEGADRPRNPEGEEEALRPSIRGGGLVGMRRTMREADFEDEDDKSEDDDDDDDDDDEEEELGSRYPAKRFKSASDYLTSEKVAPIATAGGNEESDLDDNELF